jgi:hypothetical protein
MKERMLVAHQMYQANGGQLLSYYVYSSSPPWDFVSDLEPYGLVSDTTSIKLQAIDALRVRANAVPTLGTALPATINLHDADRSMVIDSGAGWGYGGMAYRFAPGIDEGNAESALIPVRATQTTSYKFSVTTFDAPSGGRLELLINGEVAGTWQLAASGNGRPVQSPVIRATVPAGLSIVRIRAQNGTVWVKELLVQ